jgi:hypothetical protein
MYSVWYSAFKVTFLLLLSDEFIGQCKLSEFFWSYFRVRIETQGRYEDNKSFFAACKCIIKMHHVIMNLFFQVYKNLMSCLY